MIDPHELVQARQTVLADLLAWRTRSGHWVGRLSASPLSTATAVSALALVDRHTPGGPRHATLIDRALQWLARSVNQDGGWGDTDRSPSNLATTMLARAAFHLAGATQHHEALLRRADDYVRREGDLAALRRRYGRDKTFAVPILTNCALAGLVPWCEVAPLPFELACLPHGLLRFLRLPVVSYALPALVAIGHARHAHARPRNPLLRLLRRLATAPSLKKLRAMQPASGGYLEAVPLTSFVVMSLAATGHPAHPVVRDGVRFLRDSVRDDGSWPIDTNLATWNTTLAIHALPLEILKTEADRLRHWLLGCQHRTVHPFTRQAPGGWGWTDLSGAVPDADDTAGALLALARLHSATTARSPVLSPGATAGSQVLSPGATAGSQVLGATGGSPVLGATGGSPVLGATATSSSSAKDPPGTAAARQSITAIHDGVRWLLDLQNADGGWPTFCRGWSALPFDRSGPDLTAHALRALHAWSHVAPRRTEKAINRGFTYLARTQRDDGSWIPLWFGNDHDPAEENPVYGTARVLLAYRDLGRLEAEPARRAIGWLCVHPNADGGWGGDPDHLSTVEETAVATEALIAASATPSVQIAADKGLAWLLHAVAQKRHRAAAPIGLYFARLWYYESLYPLVFTLSALSRGIAHD